MSIRAVYDCMIFLQAASNPRRVHTTFRLVESGAAELCVSADILAEVRDVLLRPRHREKFPALTDEHVSEFLADMASRFTLIYEIPLVYTVDRDPKDSKYVNLAIAAGAAYLVSWDRHLLGLMDAATPEGADFLERFPSLQILDPVRFIAAVST
jgi:putative PIN family toxin of toxin-antitoxin system